MPYNTSSFDQVPLLTQDVWTCADHLMRDNKVIDSHLLRMLSANILASLTAALVARTPILFDEAVDWSRRFIPTKSLNESIPQLLLTCLEQALPKLPDSELVRSSLSIVRATSARLASGTFSSGLEPPPLQPLAAQYMRLALEGRREEAENLVLNAVSHDRDVRDIYLNVLQAVQRELGRLWSANRLTVSDEHLCTATTQRILVSLQPFVQRTSRLRGNAIAASVGPELHDLGIRMVADFLDMDGWNTQYFGGNLPNETLPTAITKFNADLLALSVTMASNIPDLARAIQMARATRPIKIIVGGAPFESNPQLLYEVGADAVARDALSAAEVCRGLFPPRHAMTRAATPRAS